MRYALAGAVGISAAALVALSGLGPKANADNGPNSAPNPYRLIENWAQLPDGRTFGQTISVDVDRDGKSIWVVERCGGNTCAGSSLGPVLKFDPDGKLVTSFGAGLFVFPHGMHVDREGNIWVTDAGGKDGKGHQVFKFAPDGKVLLTLGKTGVAGDGPDTFNRPSDAVVAPNGDVFVADGHGQGSNARIVKFTGDGKFIKTWGKFGHGPGEFELPHRLAFDTAGRLLVADRENNRIQIFDQDGNFLAELKQFGRPSGIFVDRADVLYAADSESNTARNPGFQRGMRIGSLKDGIVTAFIPDPDKTAHEGTAQGNGSAAEGVAVDAAGNVYGAEVGPKRLVKYVRN
jgi:sugar lactone lactonase YvrE